MRLCIYTTLFMLIITGLAMGAGQNGNEKIMQTYVNCTLVIQDHISAQKTLYDIVRQYKGNIRSYNFDQKNNSGSSSISISSDKINDFLNDIKKVGQIENSNFSSSDYTSSYYEYKRKLEAFQKLYELQHSMIDKMDISKEDKVFLEGELSNLINSQIASMKSSLESYKNYQNYTEVSIQLHYAVPANQMNNPSNCGIRTDVKPESKPFSWNNTALIPLYLLFMVNIFLTYFLFTKYKKGGPYVS